MTNLPARTFVALAAMLVPLSCFASGVDGASIEAGDGHAVRMLRLGVQSNWERRWWQSNGNHVGGYWDLSLAQWRGNAYQGIAGRHQNVTVIGLSPVLRWQADDRKGWYLEGGIGANLLSKLYDNDGDYLSTAFQFNDHIGFGYVLATGWDIGVKFDHFSNGGIKKPNSGVNFMLIKVARQF
ncbi:MAG: acyloxyacyl hydrolase [Pseudomonadota bacterium]